MYKRGGDTSESNEEGDDDDCDDEGHRIESNRQTVVVLFRKVFCLSNYHHRR